jgi:carbon-monoxide dehydrogenase medium subunit
MATLASLEHLRCDELLASCMAKTVRSMCTPQLRTYATVGGNLCNASPAADLSVLFVALGATARIAGKGGERTVALDEFFKGVNKTALAADEILTEIKIPILKQKLSPSFHRLGRTAVDIAQVNSAVCLGCDSKGVVQAARVCLGAVAPTPIRSQATEKMLAGRELKQIDPALLEKVAEQVRADAKPIDDMRGTAAYRRHIIGVLAKRCVAESKQNL